MLASIEASKASKIRRGTSYGSPASSPEKTTRRGTSYGSPSPEKATRRGSTLSPIVAKKQKVNVAPSGDVREEWSETEMLASTVAKKTRRGTSYGGSPMSPRQSKKQKVNSEKSLCDDGDDREEFLQIEKFGDIGDDGREDENGIAGIEEGLHFGESEGQSSQAQSSQTQASPWEVPQSSQGQSSQSPTITMGSSPILTRSSITDNSVGKMFFDHSRIAPGYHEFPSYSQTNPQNPNSSCDTRRRKSENRDS
ncbi:hypothetical protein IGI04_035252 [Brassica rapa subsp. trilocularis]|nr:hypothetical protein IGI04_035252 [Brassica rapa subsp. trilocularis]